MQIVTNREQQQFKPDYSRVRKCEKHVEGLKEKEIRNTWVTTVIIDRSETKVQGKKSKMTSLYKN